VTHKQLNIPDDAVSNAVGCFQCSASSSPSPKSTHGRSLPHAPVWRASPAGGGGPFQGSVSDRTQLTQKREMGWAFLGCQV
jgi:hypothetical protein